MTEPIRPSLTFLEASALLGALLFLKAEEEARLERIYGASGIYSDAVMEHLARLASAERKLRAAMQVPARTGLPVGVTA